MTLPVQVTYRHVTPIARIEELIQRRVEKLTRLSHRILGVQVLVEIPHRHRTKGRLYHVRVAVELPGAEIVASRQSSEHHGHVSIYRALADAFDKVRRELHDAIRLQREHVTAPALALG